MLIGAQIFILDKLASPLGLIQYQETAQTFSSETRTPSLSPTPPIAPKVRFTPTSAQPFSHLPSEASQVRPLEGL